MNQYATDAAIMEMIHWQPVGHSSDMKGMGGILDYVVLELYTKRWKPELCLHLYFFPFNWKMLFETDWVIDGLMNL